MSGQLNYLKKLLLPFIAWNTESHQVIQDQQWRITTVWDYITISFIVFFPIFFLFWIFVGKLASHPGKWPSECGPLSSWEITHKNKDTVILYRFKFSGIRLYISIIFFCFALFLTLCLLLCKDWFVELNYAYCVLKRCIFCYS